VHDPAAGGALTLHDRIALGLSHASEDMQRLAGGAAVCTFTRSGRAVPGIKYAEGRWAALRELQRLTAGADEAAAATAIAERTTAWQVQLDALVQRGAGADWIAYRTGGVDALHDLSTARGASSP